MMKLNLTGFAVAGILALAVQTQAAVLTGSAIASPGNSFNISTVGTSAWAYFDNTSGTGVASYAATNTKATNGVTIGNVSPVTVSGNSNSTTVRGSTATLTDTSFTYSDGTSPTSGSKQVHGVFNSALGTVGSGVYLTLTLPDTQVYTINLWVSGYEANGAMTASLAGATNYTDSSFTYDVDKASKLYQFTVQADNPNDVVTFKYVIQSINDTGVGASAHVIINGVAVSAATVPEAGSLSLIAMGAAALLTRYRRK